MAVEPLKERIELTLDSSGIPKNSLAALIQQLEQVHKLWSSLEGSVAQTNAGLAQTPRKVAEIEAILRRSQNALAGQSGKGSGFKASAIASALGADAAAFDKYLTGIKKGVEGYHKTIQEFRNIPSASRAYAGFEAQNYRQLQKQALSLRDLLRPSVSSVHGTGSLKVEGIIPLAIEGKQVQASVIGPITVAIPGEQIIVSGPGSRVPGPGSGGAVPEAGAPAGGGGRSRKLAGGGGRRRKLAKTAAAKKPLSDEAQLRQMKEMAFAYSENEDLLEPGRRVFSVTHQTANGTVTTMYGETKQRGFVPFKQTTRGKGGQLTPEQSRRAMLKHSLLYEQEQAEAQLRAAAAHDLARRGGLSGSGAMIGGQAALAMEDARINQRLEEERRKPAKPAPQSQLQKAWQQSFTPEGFAAHTVKVAGWALAAVPMYAAIYKPFELAAYSMQRVLDLGKELGHLNVIFKQQGGSVKELADDILGLASANGRATDEAMESAVAWSRLGLTRSQVNEAVKASMMAANVADLSMAETTKQLSSLMHIYHLSVTDLNGELGKLVYTSQHYNVTLEDLFHGLDAAGPQARQMGVSLSELQGIIAGTVGKTGQSGTVVGNTLKYILQQFNRPQTQAMLRGYGIETTTASGEMKSGPQILRELYVRYQSMTGREQTSLTTMLSGRFHGARFVGMMDSYVESQKLAIDSQLNLNAAQTANAAILDTLQNKLAGLKSEWDRFVFSQATMPSGALGGFSPMQLMTGATGGATALMRGFDETHTSAVTPLATGAGFAGAILGRRIIQSMLLKEAAAGAGSSVMLNLLRGIIPKALGSNLAGWLLGPEVGLLATFAPIMPAIGTAVGRAMTPGGELDSSRWYRGDLWGQLAGKFAARGNAASMKADLYQTTIAMMGRRGATPEARANIAKNIESLVTTSAAEMGPEAGGQLLAAFKSGNIGSVQNLLTSQIDVEKGKSAQELKNQISANQRFLSDTQAEIQRLESETTKTQTTRRLVFVPAGEQGLFSGGERWETRTQTIALTEDELAKNKQKIADLQGQINNKQAETTGLEEEEEGRLEDEFLRKQQYLSLLEQEKILMQEIGQIAEEGGTGTPLDKLNAQLAAAQMQRDLAQSTFNDLNKYYLEEHHVEAKTAWEQARQELSSRQANVDALSSGSVVEARRLQTNQEILYRRTDLETAGVGYTESEKLLNQRNRLTQDLKANQGKTPEDDNRGLRESVDLYNTNIKLAERLVDLKRQEKQIMVDANREFQKSLLFAGPGELLKRLYVSQVAQRRDPLSTGEFMSWDPSMRQMYYQMRGGEPGAKNREEQWLLGHGGVARTYRGETDQADRDQEQINTWRGRTAGDTGRALGRFPALPLPDEVSAGRRATEQIAALGSAAGVTTMVLNMVNGALTEFLTTLTHGAPFKAEADRVSNVNLMPGGFALGAKVAGAVTGLF